MKVSKLAKSVIVIGITCFVIGFLLLVFNVLIIKSVINKV